MTVGELIGSVRGRLKSNRQDALITDRYIYNLFIKYSDAILLKYSRSIISLNSDDLYTFTDAIPLKDVSVLDLACFDAISEFCDRLKMSTIEIPEVRRITERYMIRGVYSVDRSVRFTQTSFSRYIYQRRNRYSRLYNDIYYVYENNRIYILNKDIDYVVMEASFTDSVRGSMCGTSDRCKSPRDSKLLYPASLIAEAENMVVSSILNSFNIPQDANDDKKSIQRTS